MARSVSDINPDDVFPPRDLLGASENWGRTVEDRTVALEKAVLSGQSSIDGANRNIASSGEVLAEQMNAIQDQLNYLRSLQEYAYAEFSEGFNSIGLGWQPTPCSTTLSSPTGRLLVSYGGTMNGGQAYFVYQATGATSGLIQSRDTMRSNPAKSVWLSGGASLAGSGNRSDILQVPANEPITLSLEIYSFGAFEWFFGGSLLVQVIP